MIKSMVAEQRKGEGSLPSGWSMMPLAKVARVFTGSSAPQGKDYFSKDGEPFVRVSDLGVHKRTMSLDTVTDHLSQKALNECQLVRAKKGTILFPKSGAAIVNNNRCMLGVDAYIVSHLMALEPNDQIRSEWLYWALCQIDMMDHSHNDAYPSLKQSTVEKIRIPIPPRNEQDRLIGILLKQFNAQSCALRAAEAQLEAAKALPAAYLREVFNSPEAQKWPKKVLDQHVKKVGSGITPRGGQSAYVETGIPLIRSQNVHLNRFFEDGLAFITEEQDDAMAGSRVQPNDVLLNITGASIGRVCVVPTQICPANVNQHVSIIRLDDSINPHYLAYYISNPEFQKFIMNTQAGATRQALTKVLIEKFMIPIPDIMTQERIVSFLSSKFDQTNGLIDALTQHSNEITQLPQGILRKAFNGEL